MSQVIIPQQGELPHGEKENPLFELLLPNVLTIIFSSRKRSIISFILFSTLYLTMLTHVELAELCAVSLKSRTFLDLGGAAAANVRL